MAESYEDLKKRLERERGSAERQDHAACVARRREKVALVCMQGLLASGDRQASDNPSRAAAYATQFANALIAELDAAERDDRIRAAVPEDEAAEEFVRRESERFRAMDHNKLALLHACTVHDYERLLKAESK